MQSKFLIPFFILLLTFGQTAVAMCPSWFIPPGRVYHPDDNTRGLLVFDGAQEKLILEPSFTGNAKDFGLVMPTPNRPELSEAPETLFQELEDLTNPIVEPPFFEDETISPATAGRVTIIEQKDVGDYTATVLTATSASALIEWLQKNGYTFHPSDESNFNYYVAKGGFYFVALKVNMEQAKVDAQGFLSGRLSPIEFSFAVEKPMLPLRSMASDMAPMNFTLYVLVSTPYYIPGSEVLYSKILTSDDIAKVPALSRYEAVGKWLVRNNVRFDPRQIEEDLPLLNAGQRLTITNIVARRRVNPQLVPKKSGVLESETAKAAYVGGGDGAAAPIIFARDLARGARGDDVKLLQIILRDTGVYPARRVTGYFGPLTHHAVKRFQEMHKNKILFPYGLLSGTGYVGKSTRAVLNGFIALGR